MLGPAYPTPASKRHAVANHPNCFFMCVRLLRHKSVILNQEFRAGGRNLSRFQSDIEKPEKFPLFVRGEDDHTLIPRRFATSKMVRVEITRADSPACSSGLLFPAR